MSHELAAALQDPNGKPGCDFMGVNHYARSADLPLIITCSVRPLVVLSAICH